MLRRDNARRRTIRLSLAACLLIAGVVTAAVVYHKVIRLRRFTEVIPGQLYHSRQPVNDFQYAVLTRHAIRRVINLRAEAEDPEVFAAEKRRCAAEGIDFVNIPIPGVLPNDDQIAMFLAATTHRPGAVLFHCEHGRNRTMLMKAVYRVVVEDWPVAAAITEMERGGASLDDPERRRTQTELLRRLRKDRAAWLASADGRDGAYAGTCVPTVASSGGGPGQALTVAR